MLLRLTLPDGAKTLVNMMSIQQARPIPILKDNVQITMTEIVWLGRSVIVREPLEEIMGILFPTRDPAPGELRQ